MRTWSRPTLSPSTMARDACSAPGRGGEGEEERVALGVDLGSASLRASVAHDPPVLGERCGVALGAELVESLRRALDVGEEERDGARRQVGAHGEIMRLNARQAP